MDPTAGIYVRGKSENQPWRGWRRSAYQYTPVRQFAGSNCTALILSTCTSTVGILLMREDINSLILALVLEYQYYVVSDWAGWTDRAGHERTHKMNPIEPG